MASDTFSPLLGLLLQSTGNNDNTWGELLNDDTLLPMENAIAGFDTIATTGGAMTLSADERRNAMLEFTGTLSEAAIVTVANLSKSWTVRNATTGSFALTFKTASGAAATIPQGGHCEVWCDGDNNIYVGPSSRLFDTQLLAPDGTLALPGLGFKDDLDTGFRRKSANTFAAICNGAEVAEFSPTGISVTGSLLVGGERPVPIGFPGDWDGIYEPNGWKWRNGQALSRTTYEALFEVLTVTATATRTDTSTTLSSVSVDLTGLGLEGAEIEGTGIDSSATIVSLTSNSITLSDAASGSGSITIRIFPHGNGDGSTTFNVPDDRGRANVGRDNMGGTSANRLTDLTGGINGDRLGATGGSETHELVGDENGPHNHDVTDPEHKHDTPNGTVWGTGFFTTAQGGGGGNIMPNGQQTNPDTSLAATGITVDSAGEGDPHNNVQPSRVTNKIIFTGVYT